MIDRVCAESFDARKLRRRWRLRAAQDIDRAGKLCELEFEPSRSSFKQITKLSAFGLEQLAQRTSVPVGRRRRAAQDIDRAGQLRELKLKRADPVTQLLACDA